MMNVRESEGSKFQVESEEVGSGSRVLSCIVVKEGPGR